MWLRWQGTSTRGPFMEARFKRFKPSAFTTTPSNMRSRNQRTAASPRRTKPGLGLAAISSR
jgi:hypothetical protein